MPYSVDPSALEPTLREPREAHVCRFERVKDWFRAETATVVGDVELGARCSLWFGAVIRADDASVRVGSLVNFQDHVMVHPDPDDPMTIGNRVTIGHRAIVHGRRIGSNVLIGMGAIVLAGVTIGDDVVIGAGAIVTKDVPSGSLVIGAPGRVVRETGDAERADIERSTEKYANTAQFYSERFPFPGANVSGTGG